MEHVCGKIRHFIVKYLGLRKQMCIQIKKRSDIAILIKDFVHILSFILVKSQAYLNHRLNPMKCVDSRERPKVPSCGSTGHCSI